MKKLLLLAILPFLITNSAFALVGGPFGNNTFDGKNGSTATYQGAITGKNVSGALVFGQTMGTSQAFIFANGVAVLCSGNTIINLKARKVAGSVAGSRSRGTFSYSTTTTTPSGDSTTTRYTVNDHVVMNASFQGRVTSVQTSVSFSAKGTVYVTYATGAKEVETIATPDDNGNVTSERVVQPVIKTDPIPFKVSGVRTALVDPTFTSVVGPITYPTVTRN